MRCNTSTTHASRNHNPKSIILCCCPVIHNPALYPDTGEIDISKKIHNPVLHPDVGEVGISKLLMKIHNPVLHPDAGEIDISKFINENP